MRWLLLDGLEELWLWRREWRPPEGVTRVVTRAPDARRALDACAASPAAMRRLRAVLADDGVARDLRWLRDAEVLAQVAWCVGAGRLVVGTVARPHGASSIVQPPRAAPPRAVVTARAVDEALRAATSREAAALAAPDAAQPSSAAIAAPPGAPAGAAGARADAAVVPPPSVAAPLSTYEFVLLDERDDGIAGVPIELVTPLGGQQLPTDGAGAVRVDAAPPGMGSAAVADPQALADALLARVERPIRRVPLPEGDDPVVVGADEAQLAFAFPDATPRRVMVVSRADVVWGLAGDHWGRRQLADASAPRARLYPDGDVTTLHLAAVGDGARVVLTSPPLMPLEPPPPMPLPLPAINPLWLGPDLYLWQSGDTLPDVAFRYLRDADRWGELWALNEALYPDREPGALAPGETLAMPPGTTPAYLVALPPSPWPSIAPSDAPTRFTIAVDALHAALRAEDAPAVEALADAALAVPPAPAPPDWPAPFGEALLFRNMTVAAELDGFVDLDHAMTEEGPR